MLGGECPWEVILKRKFSARAYLLGLIAVAVIPVWLFAAYLLMSFALAQQQVYRDQAMQLAKQSATIVDGLLEDMSASLNTLAKSVEIAEADVPSLYAESQRITRGTAAHVALRSTRGPRIFDTRHPLNAVLPGAPPLTSNAPIEKERTIVSGVYLDSETSLTVVDVFLPITVKGEQLLLTMTTPTSLMGDVLRKDLPSDWVIGVADAAGIYVTRSERHDEVSGKPGLPQYLSKALGTAGTFTSDNQFGDTWLAGYYRSSRSGWLFAANIALSTVEAPLRQSIIGILALGSVALAASLILAYFVGQSLTAETARLVRGAIALGAGKPVEPLRTRMKEFTLVSDALVKAERMLVERTGQLGAVLETAPVAVWFTYDRRGREVIRNRFAAELMGLPGDDRSHFGVPDQVIETIAIKDGKTVSRDDRPLTRAMRGDQTDHEEFSYILPSGDERSLLTSARPITDQSGGIIGAVQVSMDITERKRSEEHRKLLTNELNHRVKNNLAIVQSLAQQTIRSAPSLEAAGSILSARLAALAHAHDILTNSSWTKGRLHEIVERSVLSQTQPGRVVISGPDVDLPPDLVMVVTLILHELTTNAIKYGALSNSSGSISIVWDGSTEKGVIDLEWAESGGPAVVAPSKLGFGSRLITRMAQSYGGEINTAFAESGLRVTISLPYSGSSTAV